MQGHTAAPPGLWLSPVACHIGHLEAGKGVVACFELAEDIPCPPEEQPPFVHYQVGGLMHVRGGRWFGRGCDQ
jgi:hypothetical protein